MKQIQLQAIAERNGGILRTSEVLEAGISKTTLAKFVRENQYERVSHGIYYVPAAPRDGLYLLHLRVPQAIFSHETALYLHGLTECEPVNYAITLKTGYNPSHLSADDIMVYTVKADLLHAGAVSVQTPLGHSVTAYDMERTICDIVRSRNNLDSQILPTALKAYVQRKDKDLILLMHHAKQFHVDKILKPYLDVLL